MRKIFSLCLLVTVTLCGACSSDQTDSGSASGAQSSVAKRDEPTELSATFNSMLDRISLLVASLKQVTDDLAHELRTPIARMRAKAEVTLAGISNNPQAEDIALDTVEECDGLLELVNTVLDISEIEAQSGDRKREPVELYQLVVEGLEVFEPLAAAKNISLNLKTLPSTFWIEGNKGGLQLAFSNLIDNAIKYTEPGGSVTIGITAEGGVTTVSITDTGIGIDAKHLPRICDRFYRVNDSRKGDGYGLGLPLARSLIQADGAEMRIESAARGGTSVFVTFPSPANSKAS